MPNSRDKEGGNKSIEEWNQKDCKTRIESLQEKLENLSFDSKKNRENKMQPGFKPFPSTAVQIHEWSPSAFRFALLAADWSAFRPLVDVEKCWLFELTVKVKLI